MKYKFNSLPSQKKALLDFSPYQLYLGGLGSGKTHCMFLKMLQLSRVEKHVGGGLLFPSYADYKKDFLPIIERELKYNRGIKYYFHQTQNYFIFPWNPKNKIFIFSAEKPIAGPNLGWGLVNEPSLIKWDRINEFIQRVRLKHSKHKQVGLYGTPEDRFGWLADFVDSRLKDTELKTVIFNVNTNENTFIDEGYSKRISQNLDSRQQKIFLQGMIIPNVDNAFYYSFNRTIHLTDKNLFQKYIPIHIGMDFNVGFMSANCSHVIGNEIHTFKEFFLKEYSSDTRQLIIKILTEFPSSNIFLYPDASAKARKTSGISDIMTIEQTIDELKKTGAFKGNCEVKFTRKNSPLRDRQLLINNLFDKNRITIQNDLKTLIKDLEKVEQSKLDYTKDKRKDDALTHMSDAYDYFLDYVFGHELNFGRESKQIN